MIKVLKLILLLLYMYSRVSNKHTGPNKHTGGNIGKNNRPSGPNKRTGGQINAP